MDRKGYTPRYLLKKKKENRMLSPLLLVLCTLTAIIFTAGVTYSRYSSGAVGEASSRVAKFQVTANGASGLIIELDADNPEGTYSFDVTSESDVAVEYDVIMISDTKVPDGIEFKLDGQEAVIDDTGLEYTFPNAATFTVLGGTNNHTLTIMTETFEEEIVANFSVRFVARQID